MTSAEFAATYRVLKTLTEQGARSQIAQEVALGRMVMVHHLDVGSAIDRQRLRAGVGGLQPAAREQVLGVHDVDGMTVVVTRFLTTFTDLPSWLRDNAAVDDEKTMVISAIPSQSTEAPPPPAVSAAPPVAPPTASASPDGPSFTAIFAPGAVATPDVSPAPPSATPSPATPSFTEMFGAVKGAPPAPPAPVAAPSAPPQPVAPPAGPKGGESFTQIFGGMAAATPASAPPPQTVGGTFTQAFGGMAAPSPAPNAPPPPLSPAAPRFDSVIPPQLPEAPRAAPATPSPPPREKTSGTFTQLFDRLTPAVSVPAPPRPPAPPPAAPAVAPPAAPAPWSLQASPPPPPTWQAAPAPPQATGNAGAPSAPGPSEFTRILGRVAIPATDPGSSPTAPGGAPTGAGFQLPPMPQLPQPPQMNMPAMQLPPMQLPQVQLPAAGLTPLSVPQQSASAGPAGARSHLPLIIALNVVLIAAIGFVLYVVLKR